MEVRKVHVVSILSSCITIVDLYYFGHFSSVSINTRGVSLPLITAIFITLCLGFAQLRERRETLSGPLNLLSKI